jgi:hypothetical protein
MTGATRCFPAASYRHNEIARPAPINASPRPSYAHNGNYNGNPDRRDDSTNRPQRNDSGSRNREINFATPVAPSAYAATQPAPVTTPASTSPVASQPNRRGDFNRDRPSSNSNDRPNRSISFPNPPAANPAPANIATVTAPRPQPSNYPYGAPPATRVVPAFVGPVVSAMPAPATTQPQQMRMPSAEPTRNAPAPAPAPATDKPQSDDRKRGVENREQKRELN